MFDSNSSIKQITGADFTDDNPQILKDKRCAFVLFYADWCGICQNFKPEFVKFADRAQFIKIYAVDADANSDFIEKFNSGGKYKIEGYPTLLIYSDGEPIEDYGGERTEKALLSKAMKVCSENCECHV